MLLGWDDLCNLWKDVECLPFEFEIGCHACGLVCKGDPDHLWFVEACLKRLDTDTQQWGRGRGGRIYFDQTTSYDTVVKRFFVAARDYGEHEVREAFKLRGKKVLGPHTPIEKLVEVAN